MLPNNFFGDQSHRIHYKKRLTKPSHSEAKQTKQTTPTMFSIKRKSAFDIRNKSSDRYNRRSSSQTSCLGNDKKSTEGISGQKIKNSVANRHIFSLTKIKQRQSSQNTPQKQSEQKKLSAFKDLKSELKNLTSSNEFMLNGSSQDSTNNYRKSLENLFKSKQRLKNVKVEQEKVSEVTQKEMKDYAKYIESQYSYFTQVKFSQLRQKTKTQAFLTINSTKLKILESVILCISDNVKTENTNNHLIQQYCNIYFQSQERQMLQPILNHHYFKNFLSRMKSVYVYHRIAFYTIFKIAEKNLLDKKELREFCLKFIELVQSTYAYIFEIVQQNASKTSKSIMEGFKTLKIVKEIQATVEQFSSLLKQMENFLSLEDTKPEEKQFKSEMLQIITNLKPFFSQNQYYSKFQQFLTRTEKILSWKFLKIPPIPFLPSKTTKNYTLVIGLNETIVNYNFGSRILKYRPYMDFFLQKAKALFEIVVFSDFQKEISDKIMKQIEKQEKLFDFRLYKTHFSFSNSKIIKDISKLGRPLEKIVLLDSSFEFYENYPQNGINISMFKPHPNEKKNKENGLFVALSKILNIAKESPEDVRKYLLKQKGLPKIPQVSSLEEKSITIPS